MSQQFIKLLKKWWAMLPVVTALFAVVAGPVWALGVSGAGMGGVETALPAEGMPLNPAAAGGISSNAIYAGAGLPFDPQRSMFFVIHQPAHAMDSALSGTLGVAHRRQPYLDPAGDTAYSKNECISYQIAYPFGKSIAGIGLRWLRETDEGKQLTAESWRLDLGWQQTLAPGFTAGLSVVDAVGNDLKFNDGSYIARQISWRAGLAYQAGNMLLIAADAWDFNNYKPTSYAVGVQVAPWSQLRLRGGYQQKAGQGVYTTGGSVVLGNWQLDASAMLGASTSGMLGFAVRF